MAAILRDSTVVVVVVVVRTHPRAIPLAMITMKKSTHGFPFVSHMSMGLRAAGAPPQNIRDFPQTKLDSEINAPFLLNEQGDPRLFSGIC